MGRKVTKACIACQEPFTYIVSRGKRQAHCDGCRWRLRLARQARYRDNHREKIRTAGREYQARRRATDPEYAEHGRARIRELARTDPDHLRAVRRRFYVRNRERVRQEASERRKANRLKIYERDAGLCHICGQLVSFNEFEVDHIVPVSRGGRSTDANLGTSHRACNRRKAARLLEEVSVCG